MMKLHHGHKGGITRTLMFAAAICVALITGYGIASLIFRVTGTPPKIIEYLISVFICLILVIIVTFVAGHRHGNFHYDYYEELFKAMDQISAGNFSVFIDDKIIPNHNSFRVLTKRLNHMAEQLGNMEVMRKDFVSNVSHELQSPLTSIKGFTAIMKKEDISHEDRLKYLKIIDMETNRLSNLSDNLLRLSALDAGSKSLKREAYSLDNQIKETLLAMELQWQSKGIEVCLDMKKTQICADQELLKQVWTNLLSNSIKFTEAGGEIIIKGATSEGAVTVTLQDSGIGMTEEQQQHIFERFYMADKARKRDMGGNGLGLALVKKIVRLHEGEIIVRSQIGEGSSFIVMLPLTF